MSYDLMVFEPEEPPRDHEGFLAWYRVQTDWTESHGYDDPAVSSPRLRAWFQDMIKVFPAMNGPYAMEESENDAELTDYCVGKSVIYAAFAWSKAAAAYSTVFDLAQRHALGFFDASGSTAEVYLPQRDGSWGLAHAGSETGSASDGINQSTKAEILSSNSESSPILSILKNMFKPRR